MAEPLDWARDGPHWPLHEHSRFVEAAGLRWHVQWLGHGPPLLLLHGTGASTHSWRGLAPLLAQRFTVIAPDLPGHGFSAALPASRTSLPGMAEAVAGLMETLQQAPLAIVGHSAGAAIALQACLDRRLAPAAVVSLNGALLAFRGWPGALFAPMARLLALNPLVPRLVAWRAHDRSAVERLVRDTGSTIDAQGLAAYARLVQTPSHVAGALAMMAGWDLAALERALPRIAVPVTLVTAERDHLVPPEQAQRVAVRLPHARIVLLQALGHLAHEEDPEQLSELVATAALAGPPIGCYACNESLTPQSVMPC